MENAELLGSATRSGRGVRSFQILPLRPRFAFAAPGELKMEKGTYRSDVAGTRDTIIYSFVDDDIEYRAVVIDVSDKANDAANLLGEAAYLFQDGKKVLMDTFGRVDHQYGRKLTIDLPNNAGRSSASGPLITGMTESQRDACQPSVAVPILVVAGVNDPIQPYDGWLGISICRARSGICRFSPSGQSTTSSAARRRGSSGCRRATTRNARTFRSSATSWPARGIERMAQAPPSVFAYMRRLLARQ
jgi:hypothetical protein